MKFLAVVLFFVSAVFSVTPALAQNSAAYRACTAKAKAQPELNSCAAEEATRVDAELNAIYRELLAKAVEEPDAVAKIKAAERAWVLYRDAYMEAMYPAEDKQAEYGSIYPMDAALLRAKLTQHQIAALKDLVEQYSE